MTSAAGDDWLTANAITPLSQIAPLLYQGMRPETYRGYDLVISCEQHLARKPMEDFLGATIHLPLRDEDEFPLSDLALAIHAAALAASSVNALGGKVLVHCTGGLNRSSLVTVEILVLDGFTRRAAVDLIRRRRDKFCLTNRAFERWALQEFLPTAETSAFRV